MTCSLRLLCAGLMLALALVTASAVTCGDTITSDKVLTANLACDCSKFGTKAALTVKGPATLDLKGHTVSCSLTTIPFTYCISILGNGATIKNGAVTKCFFGVAGPGTVSGTTVSGIVATAASTGFLLNGNNNRLVRVTAKNHINAGVNIGGKNNTLLYVTSKDNNDDGIAVTGDNNMLQYLTATGNAQFGISTWGNNNQVLNSYAARQPNREGINIAGDLSKAISNIVEDCYTSSCMRGTNAYDDVGGNVFRNNTVRRCKGNGLTVDVFKVTIAKNRFFSTSDSAIVVSSEDITITGNQITGSGGDGIELTLGKRTLISDNVIVNSARNGILVQKSSVRNTITNNIVKTCGTTGIWVQGSDFNTVSGNRVTLCQTGINAGVGASNNEFIINRAANNTVFDLSDSSANCGSNVWNGNTGKGNKPCTKK